MADDIPNLEFSSHAKEMIVERGILESWVWRTIRIPDR